MAVMCAGGDHDDDGGDDNTADDVVSAHLALTGGRDSLSCQSVRAAREALGLHKVPNLSGKLLQSFPKIINQTLVWVYPSWIVYLSCNFCALFCT